MDVARFIVYVETERRRDEAWARAEWKRMEESPREFEHEGEGQDLRIWISRQATRKRRTEQFVEVGLDEASRSFKDLNKDDKYKLLTFFP